VTDAKIKLIIESMQGITYLEWQKLRHVIDRTYDSEASKKKNEVEMASPADIISFYKQLF